MLTALHRDQMLVDEAVLESFPASDPPFWTPTHAGMPDPEASRIDTPRELRERLRADAESLAMGLTDSGSSTADLATRGLLDAGRSVTRSPEGGGETVEARIPSSAPGPEVLVTARDGADPSGITVLLGLARILHGCRFARGVRLAVLPSAAQASHAYAGRLRAEGVVSAGTMSLGSLGFGGPVRFIGTPGVRGLLREARAAFCAGAGASDALVASTLAVPGLFSLFSSADARELMRSGFPALLVTEASLMFPRRRTRRDLPDALDYDSMADVVFGLASVVARLAGPPRPKSVP